MHALVRRTPCRWSKLALLKSIRLMLKISFAGRLGLSPVISTHFTLEMYVAASNREKISRKSPILGVHGRSRSSMLVPPESSSAVLVTMRSKSVSICSRLLAILDDMQYLAETARFEGVTQICCTGTEDPFNLGGRALHR